jgi:hypothetical protein
LEIEEDMQIKDTDNYSINNTRQFSPILRRRGGSRFRRLSEHRQDQKRNTLSYIIIKMLNIKNKERQLKSAKEK